jgi:Undecaprenyl-phosphate glucose phosphotransferase
MENRRGAMLLIPGEVRASRTEATFLSKYAALLDVLLRVGDVVIVAAAAWLCYWVRFRQVAMAPAYESVLLRTALLVLLIFPAFGLYRSWRGERVVAEVGRMALAWLTVLTVLVLSEWAVKSAGDYSRLWMGGWAFSTIMLLAIHRWVVRQLLGAVRMHGADTRKVVVVGATHAGHKIIAAARNHPWMGLEVVGCVQTAYDQQAIDDTPSLGDIDSFIESLDHTVPDQIWIGLPLRAEALIQRLLDATVNLPTTVRLVPDMLGYELINHSVSTLAGVPVITLRGSRIEGHAGLFKAIEDRALAALILLLMSPLILLIAVAVKLSSAGPVIYRQKRHGLGASEIEVWKFRSMRVHQEGEGRVTQATRNDPRVTAVGRFLRRSSLDELPQLINVLQGRMSIVGPRPHAVEHNREFSEQLYGYMQRHGVKPGITGLAQIKGFRGEIDSLDKMASRVECDIQYIKQWNLMLDLKIILLTPIALFKRTNAY